MIIVDIEATGTDPRKNGIILSMPGRIVPLVTKEVYHVFNLGIGHRPTFTSTWEYKRFIQLLTFYSFLSPPSSFSRFENLSNDRKEILVNSRGDRTLVDILAYCLMPNHFHLLIKQITKGGMAKLMQKISITYSMYFNDILPVLTNGVFISKKGLHIRFDSSPS